MQRKKISAILVPAFLVAVPLLFCLKTPIERRGWYIDLDDWGKILLGIPFLIVLTMSSGWIQGKLTRKLILLASIVFLVFANDISEGIFLGRKIASANTRQGNNFTELSLYTRGDYKLSFSTPGRTRNQYGHYLLTDATLLIDRDVPQELDAQPVQLQGRSYPLRRQESTLSGTK